MVNIKPLHPAVLYRLDPKDKGHEAGARFRLDQLDGGQYGFRRRKDAEQFAVIHGMHLINEPEMLALRKALGIGRK